MLLGAKLKRGDGTVRLAERGQQVMPELDERPWVVRGRRRHEREESGADPMLSATERREQTPPRSRGESNRGRGQAGGFFRERPPQRAQRSRVRDAPAKHARECDRDRSPTSAATMTIGAEHPAPTKHAVVSRRAVPANQPVANERLVPPAVRTRMGPKAGGLEFGDGVNEGRDSHRDPLRIAGPHSKKLTFRTRTIVRQARATSPTSG